MKVTVDESKNSGCQAGCLGFVFAIALLIHVLQGGTIDATAFVILLVLLETQL